MANRIPQEFIEEVRSNTDIADIVGSYVQLKKAGKNLFGLCPFHEEKTGSFSVSEDKQIFHCFSCGRGGNVFTFIMEIENITFPESVIKVAQMRGIAAPSTVNIESSTNNKNYELRKLYEDAQKLFQHILVRTDTGSDALEYLHNRKMSDEIIETFAIGFAPDKNDFLLTFFKEKNISEDLLRKSGLFSENDAGELFDRFRGRIMFPINDQNGNIVAFSGRILDSNIEAAKYLNSPETELFNKSKTLFNYNFAKREIRNEKQVILFEGFMDVISAFQAGVKNGVASMGTSLTEQQIYLLNRLTDRIVICYDGDAPGQEATHRSISLLRNKNLDLGVVVLPNEMDPDEFIKKRGADSFKKILKNGAETTTSFEFNRLSRNYNFSNDRDRLEFLDNALKELSKVQSAVEIDIYLKKLSDILSIDINAIRQQFSTIQREQLLKNPPADFGSTSVQKKAAQLTALPAKTSSKLEIAEQNLLYLTLRSKEIYNKLVATKNFAFINNNYNRIFGAWSDVVDSELTVSEFLDYLPDNLKSIVAELEMKSLPDDYVDEEVADYIKVILDNSILEEYKHAQLELKKAAANNDDEKIIELTTLIIELKNKLSL